MLEMFRPGCRKVRRELWDYAGERLSEGPMEQVERHLKQCAACSREVKALREAQRMLATCREATPPSRAGWSDLRNRLAAEGLAGERETTPSGLRRGSRVSQMSDLPEFRSTSLRNTWLPRLSMASGFAAFLMMAAVAYRTSLPQVEKPGVSPNNVPVPVVELEPSPGVAAGSSFNPMHTLVSNPPSVSEGDNESEAVSPPVMTSESYKIKPNTGIAEHREKRPAVQTSPANYEQPRATKSNPKKNTKPKKIDFGEWRLVLDNNGKARFKETKIAENKTPVKKSSAPEQPKRELPQLPEPTSRYNLADNDYVMGSLTPVSHEDDVY